MNAMKQRPAKPITVDGSAAVAALWSAVGTFMTTPQTSLTVTLSAMGDCPIIRATTWPASTAAD